MKVRRHPTSWGEEIIVGEGARVIRLYLRPGGKVTVDLSQVHDTSWDKFIKITKKYGDTRKIEVVKTVAGVEQIIHWITT